MPGDSPTPGSRLRSFTLVEMLVVLLLLMFLFGLVSSLLGPRTIHGNQVKAAADQLASVLNKARELAMEHRSMYGVTFNIQNAPGSSGSVLNNRSGGHWYRIIGPHDPGSGGWSGAGGYNLPLFFDRNDWSNGGNGTPGSGDVELGWWLNAIQNDFVGPKYVLPKGQARFIALLDQDNGNNWCPYSRFAESYPRPWFGNFIQTSQDSQPRLYCWGGYDQGSIFQDFWQGIYWRAVRPATVNCSAFYYQGDDPPLVGCENTQDRFIIDDPNGTSQSAQRHFKLMAAGDVRPLVNGNWLDCLLLFNPDGTATMADWMSMRHQYGSTATDGPGYNWWSDTTNQNLSQLSVGDMCNGISWWITGYAGCPYNNRYENSSYADVTGTYWFTIGSDALDDTVTFPNAQAAISAMLPVYRVGVTKLGEVKVVKVTTTMPTGTTLDTKWMGTMWSNYNIGYLGFWNNLALSATGTRLMPAQDFVTPAMMTNQQWWISP
jgi:type II secretory pathway pseudopilin PulG